MPLNDGQPVIKDLWSKPIDNVFKKYKTPDPVINDFYGQVASIDYNDLNIQPFEDYKVIKSYQIPKILVTTGIKELQWAKIRALKIINDFDQIHIDDPREAPRRHKIDIFSRLIEESGKKPGDFWVIGDNPESEILAGKKIGNENYTKKIKSKPITEMPISLSVHLKN